MRSTPWPKLTLRTVTVSPMPLLCLAMTVPSNACSRSFSPSLIFTCTRMVSPGRKSGCALSRLFFTMTLVNSALFIRFAFLYKLAAQQIGPNPRRFFERGLKSPLPDLLVITAQQNFRRLPPAKFSGPRILRTIEQAVFTERFSHGRLRIPQNSFAQARDHIHHHRRRQLAAAQ